MIKLDKSYYLIKALLNKTATNSAYQGNGLWKFLIVFVPI